MKPIRVVDPRDPRRMVSLARAREEHRRAKAAYKRALKRDADAVRRAQLLEPALAWQQAILNANRI